MKKFIIIVAILAVVVGAVYIIYNKEEQKHYAKHDRLTKKELAMMRSGDIILRRGFGLVSASIASSLNEAFSVSHCGIVDVDSNGNVRVIHSVSSSLSDFDGLQDCTIEEFCKESKENSLMVVRFRDTADVPLANLAKTAQTYLDRKIPFDGVFDITQNDEMYCSEMVWSALKENYDYDIYPDKSKTAVIKFGPFFDTVHFQRIINHHKE
ncbi:MAG: hypothetical protein J6W45_07335 [Bacteroidales bacterium]|jgi:uncharacterized protein YycO|nr:hypothetical protein [Bacteroidales bacterium]